MVNLFLAFDIYRRVFYSELLFLKCLIFLIQKLYTEIYTSLCDLTNNYSSSEVIYAKEKEFLEQIFLPKVLQYTKVQFLGIIFGYLWRSKT